MGAYDSRCLESSSMTGQLAGIAPARAFSAWFWDANSPHIVKLKLLDRCRQKRVVNITY